MHFREVNTKTTFGKIHFEPMSRVSGIFSDYDLFFTVIFYVRDMYFTYVGNWFVRFREVNTKTTFGKIQFEPTSKVSGIFSVYDLLFTVIFYVRVMYFTYVGNWFCIHISKVETHLSNLQKEIVKQHKQTLVVKFNVYFLVT